MTTIDWHLVIEIALGTAGGIFGLAVGIWFVNQLLGDK